MQAYILLFFPAHQDTKIYVLIAVSCFPTHADFFAASREQEVTLCTGTAHASIYFLFSLLNRILNLCINAVSSFPTHADFCAASL